MMASIQKGKNAFPLNKMGARFNNHNTIVTSDVETENNDPSLARYLQRGLGKRPAKKYNFKIESKQEIRSHIDSQVFEKQTKAVNDKVNNIMLEKKLVQENNKMLVCD